MPKLTDEQGYEWEGEHKETELQPIHNTGQGEKAIMRTFKFMLPPGDTIPSDEELLNAHRIRIAEFLWKDELVSVRPLKIAKTKDNRAFVIFATCQPRLGSAILDRPKLIQDLLNAKHPV